MNPRIFMIGHDKRSLLLVADEVMLDWDKDWVVNGLWPLAQDKARLSDSRAFFRSYFLPLLL